jgi:tRNA/rRNA methyltransferase
LEDELQEAGFFFPDAKRLIMQHNIRAPLTRAQMSEQEVRTFRGMIKALVKGRGQAWLKAQAAKSASAQTKRDEI